MFRFADPNYLYFLIAVPVLAIVWFFSTTSVRKRRKRLADDDLMARMSPDYSGKRQIAKFILLELAVFCLAIMLARPQYGVGTGKTDKRGIEAVFVIDPTGQMTISG